MDNLTKENFFNALREKHPQAVEFFCRWIDEYKKSVNWNKLFNSDSDYQDANGKNAPAPKFHELPFEMQNGIIARFELEMYNGGGTRGKEVADLISIGYRDQIKGLFSELEHRITIRAIRLN